MTLPTLPGLMTARLVRVIAVFFLLFTAADLTVPQFCREEVGIGKFAQVSSFDIVGSAFKSPESREAPPSEPTHSDEDCFCCCSHVLPGTATSSPSGLQATSYFASLKIIDVVSPPLQGPYHPPRIA